jgi:hypothetical protein
MARVAPPAKSRWCNTVRSSGTRYARMALPSRPCGSERGGRPLNPDGRGSPGSARLPVWLAGDVVVIFGPGQHGLGCVAAAKQLGAAQIIVAGTENHDARLADARRLGATATLVLNKGWLRDAVMDLSDGRGADIVLDLSNSMAQNIATAVDLCEPRGRMIVAARQRGPVAGDASSQTCSQRSSPSWASTPGAREVLTRLCMPESHPGQVKRHVCTRAGCRRDDRVDGCRGGQSGPDR